MGEILELTVSEAKPLRHGQDYIWATILDLTRETDVFTYKALKGYCDPQKLRGVRTVLQKLETAGYLAREPATGSKNARPYRLLKRQAACPALKRDVNGEARKSVGQQNMWNVMRRARQGFTVAALALDASTEDYPIALNTAKQYCLRLERAGVLALQNAGERGVGRNVYVLRGSANSGPKAPRKYKSSFLYDPNRGVVLGHVLAEEDKA